MVTIVLLFWKSSKVLMCYRDELNSFMTYPLKWKNAIIALFGRLWLLVLYYGFRNYLKNQFFYIYSIIDN